MVKCFTSTNLGNYVVKKASYFSVSRMLLLRLHVTKSVAQTETLLSSNFAI